MTRVRHGVRATAVAVAVAVAVGLLVATLVAVLVPGGRAEDRSPRAADPTGPPPSSASSSASTGEPTVDVQHTAEAAEPERVRVPSLGIDSALDALGVDADGVLDAPSRWQVAGWYADGPAPGSTGPAVIAGHVDSPDGPAVFARLSEIAPGARIEVDDADGATRTFVVTRTTVTPRVGFPSRAVYGPTPDAQLRLITCTGTYDPARGGYQDNLLVFARAVPGA